MLLKIRQKLSLFTARHRIGVAALACALLIAGVLDSGHQHDGPVDEPQCYTCHFSPAMGLAGEAVNPQPTPAAGPVFARSAEAAPSADPAPYVARGPPLHA